jgi:hypothetical protein
MAAFPRGGKLYRLFTIKAHHRTVPGLYSGSWEGRMIGLALAMFIALFGWGARYFGWDDPAGKVQLALFTAFILGAVCGYKSKG